MEIFVMENQRQDIVAIDSSRCRELCYMLSTFSDQAKSYRHDFGIYLQQMFQEQEFNPDALSKAMAERALNLIVDFRTLDSKLTTTEQNLVKLASTVADFVNFIMRIQDEIPQTKNEFSFMLEFKWIPRLRKLENIAALAKRNIIYNSQLDPSTKIELLNL